MMSKKIIIGIIAIIALFIVVLVAKNLLIKEKVAVDKIDNRN